MDDIDNDNLARECNDDERFLQNVQWGEDMKNLVNNLIGSLFNEEKRRYIIDQMGPVSGYDLQAELYNENQPNIRELLKELPKLQVDTVLQLFANFPYDYDRTFHRYPKIVQKVYLIYQEPPQITNTITPITTRPTSPNKLTLSTLTPDQFKSVLTELGYLTPVIISQLTRSGIADFESQLRNGNIEMYYNLPRSTAIALAQDFENGDFDQKLLANSKEPKAQTPLFDNESNYPRKSDNESANARTDRIAQFQKFTPKTKTSGRTGKVPKKEVGAIFQEKAQPKELILKHTSMITSSTFPAIGSPQQFANAVLTLSAESYHVIDRALRITFPTGEDNEFKTQFKRIINDEFDQEPGGRKLGDIAIFTRKNKSTAKLFPFCKLKNVMLTSIKHQNSANVSWYFILISDDKEFDTVDDDEQDAI